MKNNISKRRINHQLFAEQYMIWETGNRWVNGIKIILNQRGQKHSLLKWRDYNTTYGISDIRVKVGSEPTWEDDRMYISQEVRPSINFLLYHAWSVQPFPPESFLPIPDVNFAANVTFRGFGFEGSDFYKIDIPEGYGIGNNIVVPPGGWWGIGY